MNQVTICNLALSRISAKRIQSLTEANSVGAANCDLFYDITRRALLRKFNWGFAKKTQALALTSDVPQHWAFEYQLPSDFVRLRTLSPETGNELTRTFVNGELVYTASVGTRGAAPYEVAGGKILTNLEDAYLVYTADITDTNLFDDLFVDLFRLKLAYDVCMPITGKLGLLKSIDAELKEVYVSAAAISANESNRVTQQTSRTSDLVEARK